VIAEGAAHGAAGRPRGRGLSDVAHARRLAALERRRGPREFLSRTSARGRRVDRAQPQPDSSSHQPPRLLLERERAHALGACPWCAALATAEADGRLVAAGRRHVALAPAAPRLPNEVWLLPRACDDDFLTTDLDSLVPVLHALFTAVRDALGRPAFNLWLHRLPGERFHWHFELQPRTGQLAGLELGGDMYINSLPARTAVARLRGGRRVR
jgi:UDPglucose--hexose-1-phosphate uridylyltransferase